MAARILATDNAKSTAAKMQSLLQGDVTAQLNQVQTVCNTLAQPNNWDGPLAGKFRNSDWPQQHKALQNAVTALDTLAKNIDSVVQDILHAGGG